MLDSIRCAAISLAALCALGTASSVDAAIDLVGATDATFQWSHASGPEPIDSYLVFVSRNGAAFDTVAQIITPAPSATIAGSPGDSIAIRVQALDLQGSFGPLSIASEIVNFLAAAPAPPPAPLPGATTEIAPPTPTTGTISRPPSPSTLPDPAPLPDTSSPPLEPPVDPGTRVAFDFDADARSELLLRDENNGALVALTTDGQRVTGGALIENLSVDDWRVVGAGDFDANGTSDLVVRDASGAIGVSFSNGMGDSRLVTLGAAAPPWEFAATGDFDGDGRADVLWRRSDNGALSIWHMDAELVLATTSLSGPTDEWDLIGSGDIDGDGTDDILWRSSTGGSVSAWRIQDGDFYAEATIGYQSTGRWDFVGSEDVDGNGKDDLVWQQIGDSRVNLVMMDGFTKMAESQIQLRSDSERIAMLGDYDGDGTYDLLTRDPVTGRLTIYLVESARIRSHSVIGETSTRQTAVGVR